MRRSLLIPLLALLALVALVAGTGATLYWLDVVGGAAPVAHRLPAVALALVGAMAISLGNVALRWVRWHFLTRRVHIELTTRDSLLLFVGTLPAILTPFYVGELIRAVMIGRRAAAQRGDVAAIWAIERCSDLLLLALVAGLALSEWGAAAGAAGLWLAVVIGIRRHQAIARGRVFPGGEALLGLALLTAAASVLPGLALLGVLAALGAPLAPLDTLGAYAHSAIVGNLSGFPLGASVAGSSLVLQLEGLGVALADAVTGTFAFRVGTVWFVVALGAAVALAYRRRLVAFYRGEATADHFDAIAAGYEAEIPEHVREPLVRRKTRVMRRHLEAVGPPSGRRGLDLGCGPGWYAGEMARAGYAMSAVEASAGQLSSARRNAAAAGVDVRLEQASVDALPFPDASFDFVYAINVMHHVTAPGVRERALAEVLRVLVPGGVFFLQEINTENPLFRFYMGYVFPLIRAIDEGTERWIPPSNLPPVPGGRWLEPVDYFTFLPDFLPRALQAPLAPLERALESSPLRQLSAHYVARLVRE